METPSFQRVLNGYCDELTRLSWYKVFIPSYDEYLKAKVYYDAKFDELKTYIFKPEKQYTEEEEKRDVETLNELRRLNDSLEYKYKEYKEYLKNKSLKK